MLLNEIVLLNMYMSKKPSITLVIFVALYNYGPLFFCQDAYCNPVIVSKVMISNFLMTATLKSTCFMMFALL